MISLTLPGHVIGQPKALCGQGAGAVVRGVQLLGPKAAQQYEPREGGWLGQLAVSRRAAAAAQLSLMIRCRQDQQLLLNRLQGAPAICRTLLSLLSGRRPLLPAPEEGGGPQAAAGGLGRQDVELEHLLEHGGLSQLVPCGAEQGGVWGERCHVHLVLVVCVWGGGAKRRICAARPKCGSGCLCLQHRCPVAAVPHKQPPKPEPPTTKGCASQQHMHGTHRTSPGLRPMLRQWAPGWCSCSQGAGSSPSGRAEQPLEPAGRDRGRQRVNKCHTRLAVQPATVCRASHKLQQCAMQHWQGRRQAVTVQANGQRHQWLAEATLGWLHLQEAGRPQGLQDVKGRGAAVAPRTAHLAEALHQGAPNTAHGCQDPGNK